MDSFKILLNRILDYQKKKLVYLLLANVLNITVLLMLIWLSTLLIDSIYYFSSSARWFILIINSMLSVFLLLRAIIMPLISLLTLNERSNLTDTTWEMGLIFPEIRDKLTNIYQLCTTSLIGTSATLKNYAISEFTKKIHSIDFKATITFKKFLIPNPIILFIFIH
jgi:hypothetical protein